MLMQPTPMGETLNSVVPNWRYSILCPPISIRVHSYLSWNDQVKSLDSLLGLFRSLAEEVFTTAWLRPNQKSNVSRKDARKKALSFRPKGEIFLRSLAFARDDRPCTSLGDLLTWRQRQAVHGSARVERASEIQSVSLTQPFTPIYSPNYLFATKEDPS